MRVVVDEVSHRFGTHHCVLDSVCIAVDHGEAVALIGPSGSGKTTLLSIAGLLLRPSAGRVLFDGVAVTPKDLACYSEVAWVFQHANALTGRTALDNASLGLVVRGVSLAKAQDKAGQMLEAVGLSNVAGQKARTLSGGELQRLSVARALATAPSLVLADEPTGNLDSHTAWSVMQALVESRPEGTSILVATHDRRVAELCDREVKLVDGIATEIAS